MYKAFKKYDQSRTGYISTNDLKKVLSDFNYFLSDDQFAQLMARFVNNY